MYQLRPMQHDDLSAILFIQTQCYPQGLWESAEIIAARMQKAAQQCWVAVDEQGVCAYLFGYLSVHGAVTPLDADFSPAEDPDCFYIHDLAVLPRMKGQGVGPALVECALESAKALELPFSALVSVQESQHFWARQGFLPTELACTEQAEHLASYQIPALYMTQTLAAMA